MIPGCMGIRVLGFRITQGHMGIRSMRLRAVVI